MTAKPKTPRTRKPAAARNSKTSTAARKPVALRAPVAEAGPPAQQDDPIAQSIKPIIGEAAPSAESGPEMKRPELVAKVMERVDTKKKDAKPVVEAVLAVLGEALAEGRELNLNPLGKVKLNRVRETGNGRIMVVKIRQPNAVRSAAGEGAAHETDASAKEAVAQPED